MKIVPYVDEVRRIVLGAEDPELVIRPPRSHRNWRISVISVHFDRVELHGRPLLGMTRFSTLEFPVHQLEDLGLPVELKRQIQHLLHSIERSPVRQLAHELWPGMVGLSPEQLSTVNFV